MRTTKMTVKISAAVLAGAMAASPAAGLSVYAEETTPDAQENGQAEGASFTYKDEAAAAVNEAKQEAQSAIAGEQSAAKAGDSGCGDFPYRGAECGYTERRFQRRRGTGSTGRSTGCRR